MQCNAMIGRKGKTIVIQCYDISKMLYKEMVKDVILMCYNRGVDNRGHKAVVQIEQWHANPS